MRDQIFDKEIPQRKQGELMIIQYDTRPDATIDEKLRSLIHSIQLALGEIGIKEDNVATSQNMDINSLSAFVRELSNTVASLSDAIIAIDNRVIILEGRQELPEAPTEDGAYKLTVTVTDGTPTYTWEAAE